jgi:hypothetical protein
MFINIKKKKILQSKLILFIPIKNNKLIPYLFNKLEHIKINKSILLKNSFYNITNILILYIKPSYSF